MSVDGTVAISAVVVMTVTSARDDLSELLVAYVLIVQIIVDAQVRFAAAIEGRQAIAMEDRLRRSTGFGYCELRIAADTRQDLKRDGKTRRLVTPHGSIRDRLDGW